MSGTLEGSAIDDMRLRAKQLHADGHLSEAINVQMNLIRLAAPKAEILAEDYHWLGLMFFMLRDFPNAVAAFAYLQGLEPSFHSVAMNLGLSLVRCHRLDEGIAQLECAADRHEDDINRLDGLADAYWKKGDRIRARRYGERSLDIKDSQACAALRGFKLLKQHAPPFRQDHPGENVISFSLFGREEQYLVGAVRNVAASTELYPGWTCRFYCDDRVPDKIRAALQARGAQVVMMGRAKRQADGLFWRFLVADDPGVARFMVRDCDSVLNVRERDAVNDWLVSSRLFHVMRDNGSHTSLMLAGMWGGVGRALPPLPALLEGFSYDSVTESRIADQLFLGQIVWPVIKHNCLIHDSIYRNFNARDFPCGSDLVAGRHVGDNDFSIRRFIEN